MIFFSLFAIVNDNKGGNKGEKKDCLGVKTIISI